MKLLDVFGTNRDTFSLGLGTEKVEFRTINGELYFRNYGGGYEKVASGGFQNSVIPREWAPETTFFTNEFIIYSGALWQVQNEHLATISFNDNLNKVLKVSDLNNFLIYDIISNGSNSLVEGSNAFIFVRGTGVNYSIILPNALGLDLGTQYLVQNSSVTDSINVKNFAGANVGEVDPERGLLVTLIDNTTTAGIWGLFGYGGAPDGLVVRVQLAPGILQIGDIVQLTSLGAWDLATSGVNSNLNRSLGMIIRTSAGFFDVLLAGEFGLEGTSYTLTPGSDYYLSRTSAGDFTTKDSKSIYYLFKALSSKRGLFLPKKRTTDLELVGPISANYSANSFELIECNTQAASFTVTLPASPTNNDKIAFIDKNGTFGQNNLIVNPGTKFINGILDSWSLDISNSYIELIYSSESESWYFNEVPGGNYGNPLAPSEAPSTITYDLLGEDENETFFTIEHNLGYFPLVQILDENNEVVLAAIRHNSINEISINLSETINVIALLR